MHLLRGNHGPFRAGQTFGLVYDPDAQDYFDRAEALGGSFDLSGINATYTAAYVKTAIHNFITGLKADSVWSKLTEIYLLTGVTFPGLMAKLKHAGTAAMTNVNFVSGDYLATGSGAGLRGDGANKHLSLGYGISHPDTLSAWTYVTTAPTTAFAALWSSRGPANVPRFELSCGSPATTFRAFAPLADATVELVAGMSAGFFGFSRQIDDMKVYKNGAEIGSDNSTASAATTPNSQLFAATVPTPLTSGWTDARMSFGAVGLTLTPPQAANFSGRVNELMTALGGNVY